MCNERTVGGRFGGGLWASTTRGAFEVFGRESWVISVTELLEGILALQQADRVEKR